MRFDRHRVLGIVVMVVSVVALALSVTTTEIDARRAECQADVNDQLVRALKARSAAAEERDAAFDTMIDAVLNAKTGAESRAAIARYREVQLKVASERRQNPLPAPPSQTC